ncbi:MAG: nickel pincer cofactor biosynthesis protein LarB [Vicinamibacterales bacterium]
MNRLQLRELLDEVRNGGLTPEAAHARLLQFLRHAPYEDLGFARVDHHRSIRQGFPEVVFGQGKTPDQIAQIAERIVNSRQNLLVTRTDAAAFAAVAALLPGAAFNELARTISLHVTPAPPGRGVVVLAAAGTADLPVAEEAAVCLEIMGNSVDRLYDVGVAGLHRLLAVHDRLTAARVVIVVAGMEGALPSVVGGLVDVPVIAVPTSVGYGASFGGITALLAMLNSCATGISVVNIDNGFGAAAIASSINHLD